MIPYKLFYVPSIRCRLNANIKLTVVSKLYN